MMLGAGVVGAIFTLGVYELRSPATKQSTLAQENYLRPASTSSTLYTPSTVAGAIDFTEAAALAMPVVVQIKAKESTASAQQRRQRQAPSNPWGDFFGLSDDFFGFPFGNQYRPREGAGSGVILTQDGYIVTNNHVIDFADEIIVRTTDEKEYAATVVGRDPSTDLAVLKIDAKHLPVIELADSDRAKVGEWVLAVGNPFEYLTSTVTAGIISAKGRNINVIRGERTIEEFIQTDAAINPGNSGGALVDVQGRLLGINTAIASPTGSYSGYSFAIPVNLMVRITDDIIKTGGVIERTNLGVLVEELDQDYATKLGVPMTDGLVVRELIPNGAAQFAGILPNDIIVKVNGKSIAQFDDIENVMHFAKVGDTLSVTVFRKGEYLDIPVRLRKKI